MPLVFLRSSSGAPRARRGSVRRRWATRRRETPPLRHARQRPERHDCTPSPQEFAAGGQPVHRGVRHAVRRVEEACAPPVEEICTMSPCFASTMIGATSTPSRTTSARQRSCARRTRRSDVVEALGEVRLLASRPWYALLTRRSTFPASAFTFDTNAAPRRRPFGRASTELSCPCRQPRIRQRFLEVRGGSARGVHGGRLAREHARAPLAEAARRARDDRYLSHMLLCRWAARRRRRV